MSLAPQVVPREILRAEVAHIEKNWFWFLILGALLIFVGMVAISSSFIATFATVVALGAFLIAGGVLEIVDAILGRGWRGFWMHLLAGILYIVVGFFMMQRPGETARIFTLMLAVAFFIGGLFRIIVALIERFHGWGWVLLNGVVTLILGNLIWREWPESAYWVIGLFVGIDMLFAGWSLVITALTAHQIAKSQVQPSV
jgi:uncharacterized membrane protein HdeD (DUF308 family)